MIAARRRSPFFVRAWPLMFATSFIPRMLAATNEFA